MYTHLCDTLSSEQIESMNRLVSNLGLDRIVPTLTRWSRYFLNPTFRGMIRMPLMFLGLVMMTARRERGINGGILSTVQLCIARFMSAVVQLYCQYCMYAQFKRCGTCNYTIPHRRNSPLVCSRLRITRCSEYLRVPCPRILTARRLCC